MSLRVRPGRRPTPRLVRRRSLLSLTGVLALVVAATLGDSGCGSSPAEPNIPRDSVAGTYSLTALSFDPQGILPSVDIWSRLQASGKSDVSLVLLSSGRLQLLFQDPATPLLRLVEGTYLTTPTGVALDLGDNNAYRALLFSRRMTFSVGANGSLGFDDLAPDGVSRAALVALVPEWSGEPLLDPMPGSLLVNFARVP